MKERFKRRPSANEKVVNFATFYGNAATAKEIAKQSEKTDSRVRKAIDKLKPDMKVRAREVEPRKPKDSSVQRHEVSQDILQKFKKLWREQRDLAYIKVNSGDWEKIDPSIIDFRVACEMLRAGYNASVVKDCLFYSPKVEDRHANVADYVARTVRKAELQVNDIER